MDIKENEQKASNTDRLKRCYLDLIQVLSDVCASNGISWYLWAGSLLGAIRHGGFIPWDDDVDTCVFSSDIDRLISAKLPEGYSFGKYNEKLYSLTIDGTTMINCKDKKWQDIVKNRKGIEGVAGIKIDIFPIFSVKDNSGKGIKRCSSLFKKDYQIPLYSFLEKKMVPFEGLDLPIPAGYNEILKRLYGDTYMIPKVFKNNHTNFIDFNHSYKEYASGKLVLPNKDTFKATENGIMFAKE